MIRECARPLLYAFFLPFLPLPLKGPTEVVDGLNHRRGSRRNLPLPPSLAVATTASRRERIASSRSIVHYEKQKCAARQWRDPWPHRTIDLTIYTYTYIFLLLSPSLSHYLSISRCLSYGICCWSATEKCTRARRRRRKRKRRREKRMGKKRCGEQGGSEDRDEVPGGSVNSRIEYVQ